MKLQCDSSDEAVIPVVQRETAKEEVKKCKQAQAERGLSPAGRLDERRQFGIH